VWKSESAIVEWLEELASFNLLAPEFDI
jgi:hypothetical protein